MTDQTIPAGISPEEAKKAREWALHALNKPGASTTAEKAVARVVIGTVPEPRPTLADMTDEEREECQWMQADVKDYEITAGIIAKINPTDAHLIASDGETWFLELDTVTPRPDLPRMEWPDADQDGEEATKVDYVSVAGGRTAYGPWTVARLRKKPDAVPESTLAVGSVWDGADALEAACDGSWRDQIAVIDCAGNVSVWDERGADWRGSAPLRFAPFTILHDGKKADQ